MIVDFFFVQPCSCPACARLIPRQLRSSGSSNSNRYDRGCGHGSHVVVALSSGRDGCRCCGHGRGRCFCDHDHARLRGFCCVCDCHGDTGGADFGMVARAVGRNCSGQNNIQLNCSPSTCTLKNYSRTNRTGRATYDKSETTSVKLLAGTI